MFGDCSFFSYPAITTEKTPLTASFNHRQKSTLLPRGEKKLGCIQKIIHAAIIEKRS